MAIFHVNSAWLVLSLVQLHQAWLHLTIGLLTSFASSALTLLVGRQEEHLACKN